MLINYYVYVEARFITYQFRFRNFLYATWGADGGMVPGDDDEPSPVSGVGLDG